MMRLLKKIFSTKLGVSTTELLVAAGVVGMIGMSVAEYNTKILKDNKRNDQELVIDSTKSIIQALLTDRESCNVIIQNPVTVGDPPRLVFTDLSKPSQQYDPPHVLDKDVVLSSIIPTLQSSGSDTNTLDVLLVFTTPNGTYNRNVTTEVTMNGVETSCLGFAGKDIEDESVREFCDIIEASYSSGNCVLDNYDSELDQKLKEFICTMIGGSFPSGGVSSLTTTCSQIDLSGYIVSKNLTNTQVCIGSGSGECRSVFDSSDCPGGQYLTGFDSSGNKQCSSLSAEPVIDGGWSAYGSWGTCDRSCGQGTTYRYRYCNNPSPSGGGADCVGDNYQTNSCYIKSCSTPNPDPNPNPDPPSGSSICLWSSGYTFDGSCQRHTGNSISLNPGDRVTEVIGNRAYMLNEPNGPYKAGSVTLYCDPNPSNPLRTHVIESSYCNTVENNRAGTGGSSELTESLKCQITCRHSDPFEIVNYDVFNGTYTRSDCEDSCSNYNGTYCDTKARDGELMSEINRGCVNN